MRALMLHGDRDLRLEEIAPPPPPSPGEVQVRIRALGLNYLDVWGFRGMAFAKRKMPQAAGVEAAGEVVALGEGVSRFRIGQKVTMYGADTCGT
jgi:NADPH:quinone reductase-like Zn-dependent oxidoreductase